MFRQSLSCCLAALLCCASFAQKVLVFSKTAGYHHASIAPGIEAIKKIGLQNNFSVDTTSDASKFTDENLKQYKLIVFLSTTGKLFDTLQKQAFMRYVHNGGGVAGIHAATDAEFNWPWYGKLMGGYFDNHPKEQTAKILVTDWNHPATKGLPGIWQRWDEWYNYKQLNNDVHVLLAMDETSYRGGKHGDFHPISWWHDFEGGRVFYTGLGHTDSSFIEPLFVQHITGGILFALNKASITISTPAFDAKRGIDKYLLGAQFSSFDTTALRRAGEPFTFKGKTETTYVVAQPVLIGGVSFQEIILTFDGAGKLSRIQLFRAYRKRWDRDYKETATNSYNTLAGYVQKQLNKKGKKKKFTNYKDIHQSGYEWTNQHSRTQASLYIDDGQQALYDVRLLIELKD